MPSVVCASVQQLPVCLSVCLGKSLQRCVQSSGSADLLLLPSPPSAPLLSFSPSLPLHAAPCPVSYCVVTMETRPETVPGAPARLQPSFITQQHRHDRSGALVALALPLLLSLCNDRSSDNN